MQSTLDRLFAEHRPGGSGKEATRKAQNRGRGLPPASRPELLRRSGLARSGPGAAWASLRSISPQAGIPRSSPGSVASCFWTVFPCTYGGTRIAARNVTPPKHWCHLVRIGEDLHDHLGSALAFRTIGRIFETVARTSLSTFIRRRWHRQVDRYGAADCGRPKPRNQRWIDFLRSTT